MKHTQPTIRKSRAKCTACADGPAPGVLNNGERCDTCERFDGDHSAVLELVRIAHVSKDLLVALEKIASDRIIDIGENRLGTVSIDFEAARSIARAAIAKATNPVSTP